MFGNNTRVGKSFFDSTEQAQNGKLMVTSVFYTLQGEGRYSGSPAVFIRLTKCHLACSFCLPAIYTVAYLNGKQKTLAAISPGEVITSLEEGGATQILKLERLLVDAEDLRRVTFVRDHYHHTITCHKDHKFAAADGTFISPLEEQFRTSLFKSKYGDMRPAWVRPLDPADAYPHWKNNLEPPSLSPSTVICVLLGCAPLILRTHIPIGRTI
jgi:hypothetical protein